MGTSPLNLQSDAVPHRGVSSWFARPMPNTKYYLNCGELATSVILSNLEKFQELARRCRIP